MTLRKTCKECGEPIQHSGPPLKIWCACDVRFKEHMDAGGAPIPKKWLPDVTYLECNCCGSGTRGRQWWNRDTGYGMCTRCIAFVRKQGMGEEEIRDLYGVEGIHWGTAVCSACKGKGFVNPDGSANNAFEGADSAPTITCPACKGIGKE